MQKLLLSATAQAGTGSMSLADAAKQMGVLGSTRSSFAGDVAKNQQTLIGFGQIARAGGDVGEAGTFVKDIALEATMANKRFKKETGRSLFKTDKFGRMESPEGLVADVFKNTGGNIQQINQLFGIRGGALFRELEGSFIKGAGPNKNVAAGVAAVQANMREVTGATMSPEDLESRFRATMDVPAEKFGASINKIEEELKERFAPAVEKLADILAKPEVEKGINDVIDAFAGIAKFLIENPLRGIGTIITAAVTADIAKAAIGQGIKSVVMSMLGGGGGGGFGAGAGLLGKVGAAAGIAAGAAGITMAGMSAIDAHFAGARGAAGGEITSALGGTTDAAALMQKARAGKVTAADIQKMSAAEKAQEGVVAQKLAAMQGGPGLFAKITGAGDDVAADQKAQYKLQKEALDDMVRSLKAASAALNQLKTSAPPAVPPITSNAPSQPVGHDSRAKG
jgi:hypothetical protein